MQHVLRVSRVWPPRAVLQRVVCVGSHLSWLGLRPGDTQDRRHDLSSAFGRKGARPRQQAPARRHLSEAFLRRRHEVHRRVPGHRSDVVAS
jgi:hypothetical protein